MTIAPDSFVNYVPDYCSECGKSLADKVAELESQRQVVDLPSIRAIWTEHRQYSKTCSCGHKAKPNFPKPVSAPVQYGSGIESLICYLHGRQYLPYDRMAELLKDSYGVKISQGSIENIIKRFADKGSVVYDKIRAEIMNSQVIGSDETGIKIGGKKYWAWTWQDVENTLISISQSRGIQAITESVMNHLPKAIICHDAWRAQFSIDCRNHQLCCAHLMRDLNYLNERYKHTWSKKFQKLLYQALRLKKQMEPGDYESKNLERDTIISSYHKLLDQPPDKKCKELHRFYKRIVKYKDHIFPFLYHHGVPPDNNASERAIRNIKVKQKISGQFRSMTGARNFAIIRSIIDTLNKRNLNIFQNLQLIANFNT
jgi:transposase